MSETKHKPGPWRASVESSDDFGHCLNVRSASSRIASVVSNKDADARLIAAAPDLLEALKAIASGLTNGQIERGETFQSIARAAIAKARVRED